MKSTFLFGVIGRRCRERHRRNEQMSRAQKRRVEKSTTKRSSVKVVLLESQRVVEADRANCVNGLWRVSLNLSMGKRVIYVTGPIVKAE